MIIKILLLILLFLIGFIIFSLPLFIGLLVMGRPHTLFKTGITTFLVMILSAIFMHFLPSSLTFLTYPIIAIIAIIIYRESFKLKWWKAMLVYLLQALITYIMYAGYSIYF